MAIKIDNVAVLGLGTLGGQIALQARVSGYEVTAFDPDPDALKKSLEKFMEVDQSKVRPSPIRVELWPEAASQIRTFPTLADAVKEADLVIEVVPEELELKRKVWKEMDEAAPPEALFATNSSSMPVSRMEGATGRPERCMNLHFYHMTLGQNMADVMGGSRTTPEVLEAGRAFVRSLGVVPLKVNKEILGFCFNRVWRAIKRETLHMWADGYVDFKDVDRAWMIFAGTPWGPFALMDTVGLDVIYDIEMVYYEDSKDPKDHPPQGLKRLVEEGKLGVKAGEGFYKYPNPAYLDSDFLKP